MQESLSVSPPDAGLGVLLCGIKSPEDLLLTNCDHLWGGLAPASGFRKSALAWCWGSWVRKAAVGS